ncbi:MAG: alpha,alpha-phosphotrehalase [Clostridium sp.]|uniref:alpha,alpha-phosphotrehalase n=1 Tax=Clostridium sp. TaxID=1506 RepID=UPI0039EB2F44
MFKKSTIYQVYPKSFKDTNDDGQGDIKGIIEKLQYLENLGIDYIWLTPIFTSPQRDNGYDVEDYYKINPQYGTMKDLEELIKKAGEKNIKIMLDMVFNHTSTEHRWFKKALTGEKKYMDYYIFKEPVNNGKPTNWVSKFGGSAWEYVPKLNKYYLHLFDKTQADLNWENKELRQEMYNIVNFWIDKGIKGFRFDVVNLLSKPTIYEDDLEGDGRQFYTDGPNIHKYLKKLSKETFGKYSDIITVGEMSSTTVDNCIKYTNPAEKELNMVFNFHHLKVDYKNGEKWTRDKFRFKELKEIFNKWQVEMDKSNGWNALFWCNHDQPRAISRFGNDKKYHTLSGKMLAAAIHMMKGTPYIYQGEEIGMTNAEFNSINQYRDIESLNYYKILKNKGIPEEKIMDILKEKSRDNGRTPMQWDSLQYASFSKAEPWIDICKNYESINVLKALECKNSIFYFYKKLITLRKELDVIAYGDFKMIFRDHSKILAYERNYKDESLIVICNFYEENIDIVLKGYKNFKVLISNYEDAKLNENIRLRPYETIVYYKRTN